MLCHNIEAEDANPDSTIIDSVDVDSAYIEPTHALTCDSISCTSRQSVSHLRYSDFVKVVGVSPLECLLLDASLEYAYRGTYGHRIDLLSNISGRKTIGVSIDDMPLYDSQLEDPDVRFLPPSAISSVCYHRLTGCDSKRDSPAVLLESLAPVQLPTTRIGVWWADFGTRSIDLFFARLMKADVGVGFGYQDLRSSGWLENSRSDSRKYFGKISIPTVFGDFGGMVIGYDGSAGLPGASGSESETRKQLGLKFKRRGRGDFQIQYFHIANDHTFPESSSSFRIDAFESIIERSIASGIDVEAGLGHSFKRYQDSQIGEVKIDDSRGSIWLKMSRDRTDESLSIEILHNSLHGTKVSGFLGFTYRWSQNQILLNLERTHIFPKLSNFISRRGSFIDPLVATSVKSEACIDMGFSNLVGYAFLNRFDQKGSGLEAQFFDGKTYGTGVDLCLDPLKNLDLRISYSLTRSQVESCKECQSCHIVGCYFDVSKAISSHINLGLSLLARWVSSRNLELLYFDCSERSYKRGSGYIYAIPAAYLQIDRAICFFRVRNALDEKIDAPCNSYRLPGRTLEFGTIWHLLD